MLSKLNLGSGICGKVGRPGIVIVEGRPAMSAGLAGAASPGRLDVRIQA
jgi:hypothetical protein